MRSVSEKIDERILRLLGLEDVFDLDYDTYLTLLKEAIVTGANKLPQEELAILANERKRVRGKKGRFSPKKEKITASKVATTKFLKPAKKTLALPPSTIVQEKSADTKEFGGIKKTLDSILKTLGSKFKFDQKQADQDRREKETEKRGRRESTLEGFKKGVAGIVATTKKMLSPFQAIIDRIWRFIFFTLLGRAFTSFMEWMGNKENQKKFNSFIEFLSDHFPALVGLYILFGTSFGKLVRGLLKGVVRMSVALAMNIPKIARFIKRKPKLAGLLFSGAALASGYVSRQVQDIFADKQTPEAGLIPSTNPELDQAKQSSDQATNTKVPRFNLGGMIPSFSMGGFTPFGGMNFNSGIPIAGAGQDDTLIAAKTGEAILTQKDQADISQRYVDRNTGQPLIIPQYLAGRKPGYVNSGNLIFPGFGGGFFGGGVIPKFNSGGIVGNISNLFRGFGGKPQGLRGTPVKRIMHGTKAGIPELIRAGGFRGQTGMLGKGVYGSTKGWVADTYRGAGTFKGVLPGVGPRLDMLVPQAARTFRGATVVSERQANRGLRIAEGILSGKYTGARARSLLPLLTAQTPSMARAFGTGAVKLGGKMIGALNAPLIGDMLFPEGTSQYDQLSGPGSYYNAPGYKPIRRQGGGLIERKATELVNREMPNTIRDYYEQLQNGFIQPMSSEDTKKSIEEQRKLKIGKLIRDYQLYQNMPRKTGGGLIKENTGRNIPGATADRQLVAAQPGEFMIPVDTVNRYGISFFEKLVAMSDSNSDAYLKKGNSRRPQITPYRSFGSSSTMTLPPITQSSSGSRARSAGLGGGSEVPQFSAIALSNERAMNASIYGLVG